MPFKEKIAWISVITTVLVWGTYFGFLLGTHGHMPGPVYVVGFVGAAFVQTVLMIIASIVTAVMAPRDAGAGSDERDKAIAQRAYAIAYPVLLSLIVLVAISMHFGMNARDMTYEIMGAIVIAEIVHYAAQIRGYRRGY